MVDPWYAVAVRLDGQTRYFLWMPKADANDVVFVKEGHVVSNADLDGIRQLADREGLWLMGAEPDEFDLDAAIEWTSGGGDPDLSLLLDTWNLADDFARSLDLDLADRGDVLDNAYDNLVLGQNLLGSTGDGYVPEWTGEQIVELKCIIEQGVGLIRSALGHR